MAWDTDTQFIGSMGNLSCDGGQVSFVTSGTSVEINTHLTEVHAALATAAHSAATGDTESLAFKHDSATANATIEVSGGKVTLYRTVENGGSITSDLRVSYLLIGI